MIRSFLIIVLVFIQFDTAQSASKYGGAFLELGVGARALAMGGANVALTNDAYSPYWNPSGLAFLTNYQAAAMYSDGFDSFIKHNFVNIAAPIFGGATVSLSWVRLSVDNIPETFLLNDFSTFEQRQQNVATRYIQESENSFGNTSDAFILSFAKYHQMTMDLGWMYFELPFDIGYGVNFKSINESLHNKTGSGLGIDIGLMLKIAGSELFEDDAYGDFTFGINAQDISGTIITWDTDSKSQDIVERNFKIGFGYIQPMDIINSQLTFAYDRNTRYQGTNHFGFEFLYNSIFAVRSGLDKGEFTTGAGFTYWKIKMDYAYQGHDFLGNSHRISLLFNL